LSKSAAAGEKCAACREVMNESAVVCSYCGAHRSIETGLAVKIVAAILLLAGLYVTLLSPWSRYLGIGLLLASVALYFVAPRRIVYRHRR